MMEFGAGWKPMSNIAPLWAMRILQEATAVSKTDQLLKSNL